MFIQLSQMLSQANLSGIHLMIRPMGEGKLSIMVATESNGFKANNPALKAALSQPLNVVGLATELGDDFGNTLQQFIDSYCEANQSNLLEVTETHAKITKNQTTKGCDATASESDEEKSTDGEKASLTEDNLITDTDNDLF